MPIDNAMSSLGDLGSTLARSFEMYLAALGRDLPEHETEYAFASPRKWKFDYAWVPQRVAVELEGGAYGRRVRCQNCGEIVRAAKQDGEAGREVRIGGAHNTSRYFSDLEKYNVAAALGWCVLRFTRQNVENDPHEMVDLLRRVLDQRDNRVKLVEDLTDRESEVLQLIAGGFQQREISNRLACTEYTVKRHAANIMQKLQARNRVSAVVRAISWGLLDIDDVPFAEVIEIETDYLEYDAN